MGDDEGNQGRGGMSFYRCPQLGKCLRDCLREFRRLRGTPAVCRAVVQLPTQLAAVTTAGTPRTEVTFSVVCCIHSL